MKTLLRIVLILISAFALEINGYCAETDGANLLPNPGFEEGGKMPTGWSVWQGGDCCTFVWDRLTAHGGTRSLYVCNADKEGSLAWTTSCKLKPETSYRFTAWVKIQKAKGSRGIAALRVRGGAKGMDKKWDVSSIEPKGDTGNQWQQMQLDFKTPPGLEGAVFWLWSVNGRGDQVWFDDVELKELAK